jgi:glyoxylase-like metal-dependent hydrolase (beta-lactamase superfamily II)
MLRRDFLTLCGGVPVAVAAFAAGREQEQSLFLWERIRSDAWVVFHGGGNVLVIAEPAGAIVIDCKINGMGQLLRAEIASRVGPIAAVVITHHHGDHSGGYPAFAGTRAVAHAAALPRIRGRAQRLVDAARDKPQALAETLLDSLAKDFEVPRGDAARRAVADDVARIASVSADLSSAVPGEEFAFADRTELRVGNTTLELIHVGPAHTDNDVFVIDRRRRILHTGDLLFHRHHASIDTTAGGTMAGWVTALGAVRRACGDNETVVVAGHGPTGTRAGLDEQVAYFERVRDLVGRERAKGRSREEIVKLPNSLFPDYGFVGEWPDNLGIAFDEGVKPSSQSDAR